MRGPIDFIIVGFVGNQFNGSILKALGEAIDSGAIGLVGLAVISKDKQGNVTEIDIANGNGVLAVFAEKYGKKTERIMYDDIHETAELLEPNTSAGLLIVEQLWAKPLKKALLDANGVLISEGRIHPEAARELDKKGAK